jgi:hypothetical protein
MEEISISVAKSVGRWIVRWGAKKLVDWVLDRTVLHVLRESHKWCTDLRFWQRRWIPLSEGLDYQLVLRSMFMPDASQPHCLYLRNTGKLPINDIKINVMARRGKLSRPELLDVALLEEGAYAQLDLLRSVPALQLWAADDGIHSTCDSVQVSLLTAQIGGEALRPGTHAARWSISYDDWLNGHWVRLCGQTYNTDAIEHCATQCLHKLYWWLCRNRGLPLDSSGQLAWAWRRRQFALLPRVLCYQVLSARWLRLTYCWSMLLLRRRMIRFLPDGPECWQSQ